MREQLEKPDAHRKHLHIQLRNMRDTLYHEESEFSALTAEYLPMIKNRFRLSPRTDYGGGANRGKSFTIVAGSSFKGVDMTRAMNTALFLDSLLVAVVHTIISLNLCGYAHHMFRKLNFTQLQHSLS